MADVNYMGIILLGIVILISVLDLSANVVSLLPVIGDFIETIGETIFELSQIALFALVIFTGFGRKNG